MYSDFINAYVIKQRRSRLLDFKMSANLLDKLCHSWESVIDMRYAHKRDTPMYRSIAAKCKSDKAQVISFNDKFNGIHMNPPSPHDIDPGFPVILCFDNGCAYFKTESMPRCSEFYLLKAPVA